MPKPYTLSEQEAALHDIMDFIAKRLPDVHHSLFLFFQSDKNPSMVRALDGHTLPPEVRKDVLLKAIASAETTPNLLDRSKH